MVVQGRHEEDALLGALVVNTWIMTDSASATNKPPMMMDTNSVAYVTTARHPSAMPSASDPVSLRNRGREG